MSELEKVLYIIYSIAPILQTEIQKDKTTCQSLPVNYGISGLKYSISEP